MVTHFPYNVLIEAFMQTPNLRMNKHEWLCNDDKTTTGNIAPMYVLYSVPKAI